MDDKMDDAEWNQFEVGTTTVAERAGHRYREYRCSTVEIIHFVL